jgi:HPt (histidine-containing phosphotransfer) domain-containing protein
MAYSIYVDPDLADYIPTFVANRKKELIQAKSDLDAKNFEALRALGHTLKGCCASYGFVELGELGKKLEMLSKEEKSEDIASLLKDMNWLLDHYQVVENPPQNETHSPL